MEYVIAHGDPDMFPVFLPLIIMLGVLFVLGIVAVKIVICCSIFSKAGYCWALGLLMLFPLVDIIMVFILAFGDWPVRRELRLLKQNPTAPG